VHLTDRLDWTAALESGSGRREERERGFDWQQQRAREDESTFLHERVPRELLLSSVHLLDNSDDDVESRAQSLLRDLALARPPRTHLSPTWRTSSRHPSPTRRSCARRRKPYDAIKAAKANVESEMSGKA